MPNILGHIGNSTSSSGGINTVDLFKTIRMAIIMGMGVVITYLLQNIGGVDFGQYQWVATLVITPLLEITRRWFTEHQTA